MQASVIYECQRGGCDPWYTDYWSIFPLIFLTGYIAIKIITMLERKTKLNTRK